LQLRQEEEKASFMSSACLGDEKFRKDLLAQMKEPAGEHHDGPERQESAEEQAERLVRAAMKQQGLNEQTLADLPKAGPAKLAVARRLRAETTVPLKWIASRGRTNFDARLFPRFAARRKCPLPSIGDFA
jgi:hypothetical protein